MRNKILPIILVVIVVGIGSYLFFRKPAVSPTISPAVILTSSPNSEVYSNTQYGFSIKLPISWKGYSILTEKWQGAVPSETGEKIVAEGPELLIRHPFWTEKNPRQDIPIMVFTLEQWDSLQQDKFHIGAAPINPSELGRNSLYAFALPARYNYAFPTGWEEVDQILKDKNNFRTF